MTYAYASQKYLKFSQDKDNAWIHGTQASVYLGGLVSLLVGLSLAGVLTADLLPMMVIFKDVYPFLFQGVTLNPLLMTALSIAAGFAVALAEWVLEKCFLAFVYLKPKIQDMRHDIDVMDIEIKDSFPEKWQRLLSQDADLTPQEKNYLPKASHTGVLNTLLENVLPWILALSVGAYFAGGILWGLPMFLMPLSLSAHLVMQLEGWSFLAAWAGASLSWTFVVKGVSDVLIGFFTTTQSVPSDYEAALQQWSVRHSLLTQYHQESNGLFLSQHKAEGLEQAEANAQRTHTPRRHS